MNGDEALVTALRPVLSPIVSAQGGFVTTADGRRFMDLAAQTLNMATGQPADAVTAAVRKQAEQVHFASSRFATPVFLELAERLARLAPAGLDSVVLKLSDGSDAVETAIKIALLHTGRTRVGCLPGAWHGETYLTLGLASSHHGRVLAEDRLPVFANEASITALTQLVGQGDLAAVVVDPMMVAQGLPPSDPRAELAVLRTACDNTGTLLIFDEIQAFGWNVGGWFTTDIHGVRPDMICLGKALGGGLPLAAVIAHTDYSAILAYNDAEFTGGGAPIPCAAAMAILDCLAELQPSLGQRAADFDTAMTSLYPADGYLLHRSGLAATITTASARLREAWAREVSSRCMAAGLFVRSTDRGRRILIKPPLVLPIDDLRRGLADLARICHEAAAATNRPSGAAVVVQRSGSPREEDCARIQRRLTSAAPGVMVRSRSPLQQQAASDKLAAAGVPVAVVYATDDGRSVDYARAVGRPLSEVLGHCKTPAGLINAMVLRHIEAVVRAADHGVIVVSSPYNAVVSDRAELVLTDIGIALDGPPIAVRLAAELLCVMDTLDFIDDSHVEVRDDLLRRLLERVADRHGLDAVAAMASRLSGAGPVSGEVEGEAVGVRAAAHRLGPIVWSALSRARTGRGERTRT